MRFWKNHFEELQISELRSTHEYTNHKLFPSEDKIISQQKNVNMEETHPTNIIELPVQADVWRSIKGVCYRHMHCILYTHCTIYI